MTTPTNGGGPDRQQRAYAPRPTSRERRWPARRRRRPPRWARSRPPTWWWSAAPTTNRRAGAGRAPNAVHGGDHGAAPARGAQAGAVSWWSTARARPGREHGPDSRVRGGRRQPLHHRLGAAPRDRAGLPGLLAYNDRPTRERRGADRVRSQDNPFPEGGHGPGRRPALVAGGLVLPDPDPRPGPGRDLLESRELADKYGEAPIAVLFKHGQGEVFHMISHYPYNQRADLREQRAHRVAAASYAAEKASRCRHRWPAAVADLALGEVEAATSSTRSSPM